MIKFLKILAFCVICSSGVKAVAQTAKPVLFADRDYCVSGDTVWFKVWLPEQVKEQGNIIRVQLDGKANTLISGVACKNTNGWSEGFIPVPDSLSTGQYFLSAFLNAQRNLPDFETESISLIVYNRFAEKVDKLDAIQSGKNPEAENFNAKIQIETDKNNYLQRENVSLKIEVNPNLQIKNAILNVALVDPLAEEISGRYNFKIKSTDSLIPGFIENNGVVISGKVLSSLGVVQPHVVVILSIAGDPPYFDYYFTGANGDFHFFLKDAKGLARIVLQVVSGSEEELFIRQEENYLMRENEMEMHPKILKPEQTSFIADAITGNFVHKLFYPNQVFQPVFFEMPARFSMPFYGTPTRRVIPDEFIDLPDFQEISRELLHGFQYRVKKDVLTFRMINNSKNAYFDDEPLRLINGIPVFKNSLFSGLKSTDIEYIDIVQEERIFGDLRFEGIVSVVLRDKTNLWMAQQPGVAQFNINCLQPEKKPTYLLATETRVNQPDIRRNFFWQIVNPAGVENIQFKLSDMKGKVRISVEGITGDNMVYKSSKIIEVK